MLNYSYPPILYQRENEDDEEDEEDGGLPDFAGGMDDEDDDIEELIRGGGKQGELYKHLNDEVENDDGPYYMEKRDKDGNVYLVEANEHDWEGSDVDFDDDDDI